MTGLELLPLILAYIILNVCHIGIVLGMFDYGCPPLWFQVLMFPSYIFFNIRSKNFDDLIVIMAFFFGLTIVISRVIW